MVELTTNYLVALRIPDRSERTIRPIATQFSAVGSRVNTDGWSAYNFLGPAGWRHLKVCHKRYIFGVYCRCNITCLRHLVDPVTGEHTNNIERNWKHMKEYHNSEEFFQWIVCQWWVTCVLFYLLMMITWTSTFIIFCIFIICAGVMEKTPMESSTACCNFLSGIDFEVSRCTTC